MLIRGIPRSSVARIASTLDLGVEWKQITRSGRVLYDVALRPLTQRFAVVVEFDDDSEVTVVCQHGHEAFLTACFDEYPSAYISTPIAKYKGRDGFVEVQPSVRLVYAERYGVDPCSCSREHPEADGEPDPR